MLTVLVSAYLVIGFANCAVGPGRRLLEGEMETARRRRWTARKRAAALLGVGLVTLLLWPVSSFAEYETWKASRRASAAANEIRRNPNRTIALDELMALERRIGHQNAEAVRAAMREAAYLVAMGSGADGRPIAVTPDVAAQIQRPISVTQLGPDDWRFTTSAQSWRQFMGRSGRAKVQDGVVVEVAIERMN